MEDAGVILVCPVQNKITNSKMLYETRIGIAEMTRVSD